MKKELKEHEDIYFHVRKESLKQNTITIILLPLYYWLLHFLFFPTITKLWELSLEDFLTIEAFSYYCIMLILAALYGFTPIILEVFRRGRIDGIVLIGSFIIYMLRGGKQNEKRTKRT